MKQSVNIGRLCVAFCLCGALTLYLGACGGTPGGGGTNQNGSQDNTNENTSGGDDNQNGGGGPGPVTGPTLVNTGIGLHPMSRIEVGDDLIAFSFPDPDGTPGSVGYIIPSEGDTELRGITGIDPDVDFDSFAVSGKKIALVGGAASDNPFQVSIFDTTTSDVAPILIPVEDVRLGNIPVGNSDPGHIQADGDYVVVRHEGPNLVKVIDISGSTPVLIPFTVDPGSASSAFGVPQVLVDDETMTAVAVSSGDDGFYVYDIANPDAAPTAFVMADYGVEGIGDSFQHNMDDGVIFFVDDSVEANPYYLDITDPTNEPVPLSPSEGSDPEVFNGYYGYFSAEGPSSAFVASAVGLLDDASPAVADDTSILEGSANWGFYGQGGSLAIAQFDADNDNDDDIIWFVAAPIQWSITGGAGPGNWNVFYDPDNPDTPLFGGNLNTSADGSLLGFAWQPIGAADSTLGYAILD